MSAEELRIPKSLRNIDGINKTIEQIRVDTKTTHENLQSLLEEMDRLGFLRKDENYNGWSNYETWAVHLWLTNEQGTYNFCRELAHECIEQACECAQVREGIWQEIQARRFLLADRLKQHIQEHDPLADHASMYSDLLGAAISEVDWHEVANAFLGEFSPEDDEQ